MANLFVLISFVCAAFQFPDEPPAPSGVPPGLPIDGGVLMGALFAILYGAKKMLTNKK